MTPQEKGNEPPPIADIRRLRSRRDGAPSGPRSAEANGRPTAGRPERKSNGSSFTPPLASPGSAIARTSGSSARKHPVRTPCLPGGFKDAAGRIKRAGGALPPLRSRPGRPGRRRGDGRRRRHPLDGPSRQHQSRLVQLRHCPRHSPGQGPPRRAAASRARSDALAPPQRGDHRSRQLADRPRTALDRRSERECRRCRMPARVSTAAGSSASRSRLASCGPMTPGVCSSSVAMGRSGPAIPGTIAVTFANNDLWYDDTSDGPVDATVRIDGREIPVTGAWVVVAPPNYAPGIQSVVTMYDVMFEVATYPGARAAAGAPVVHPHDLPVVRAPGAEPVGQCRVPARFRLGVSQRLPGPGHPAVARQPVPDAGAAAPTDLRALSRSGLHQHGIRRPAALLR